MPGLSGIVVVIGADGLEGEFLKLGDQGADLAGVVEQGLPVGELPGGEAAGDGLAADLAGPLGVGAVQRGWVSAAAAAALAAGVGAHEQGAGQGGPGCGGELGGDLVQGPVRGWFHATHRLRSRVLRLIYSILLWTSREDGMGAAGTAGAGYIAAWRPSSVSAEAACFARLVVSQAAPPSRDRAKNLLWAAGKPAGYGTGLGLEPVPAVLLHPSVIERFAAHAPGLSGPARRTLRTNLRFLARAVVPQLCPADAPLPRERAKAPYTAAEIAGFLALADAQPTAARRARAAGLVCLGAGAGLIRSDLRNVRGSDVTARSGGVIVDVRGRRPA